MKALDVSYSVQNSNSVGDNYSSTEDLFNLYLSANPVSNNETRLFYTLKNPGNLQISIMDNLGREVHQLFNEYAEAGQKILPIDPSKFVNGTYFIRITADGITAMKKLVVTK